MRRFRELLRFELRAQLARPMVWLFIAVFAYLAFAATSDGVDGGGRTDEVFFNSSIDVAAFAIIVGMISLLVAAVLTGDAAARHVEKRIDPLLYVLPLGRAQFVVGRFLAPLLIHALLLLLAVAGLALLPLLPKADPALVGPFRPASYALAYLWFMLPNAIVAHAIMFATASLTRRAITAFVAGAILFFLSLFIPEFIGGQLNHWTFARWFDPSGYATLRHYMDTWAPAQQNALIVPIEGMVLWNRLFWLTIAAILVAGTVARFRFEHHAPRARRSRVADIVDEAPAGAPVAVPRADRHFGVPARLRQLAAELRMSLVHVAQSRGLIFLVVGPALLFLAMPEVLEQIGVPLEPTTSRLVLAMRRAAILTSTAPLVLIMVFAGELIWGERQARMNAMADAAPVPDWVPLLGKLLALIPMLLVHQALLFLSAIGIQRMLGHAEHQVALLAQYLFGFQMLDYVLFAALAVAVHAVVNQKYVGHLVLAVVWLTSQMAHRFGIEHDMLRYSGAPAWSHTDMTAYGGTVGPWLWHKLYWLGWALVLLTLARVFWPRGAESGIRTRLRVARAGFRRAVPLAAGAVAILLVSGGFTFWNTYVRSEHLTPGEVVARAVAYERAYARYEDSPRPSVSAMSLRVELQPLQGRAGITGRYVLANRTDAPIDTIHVATSLEADTRAVGFDRPARMATRDDRLGHRIFVLSEPLQPGDSMAMTFALRHAPRGFDRGANPIGPDGAVIDHEEGDWLPRIGYQDGREAKSPAERRRHGLPERPALPRLEDAAAWRDPELAGTARLDIVVGTDPAHTAVAPGVLRRTWSEDGRRWFHYSTDVPVQPSWVIMSAPYERRTGTWRDVPIEVFYHPDHEAVVERVLRSARASLAYFTEQYGPYPFRSLRFAERPGYGVGANAHPGFVDYSEGFSLMDPTRDRRDIDFVFAIAAHEVAHQWWGHQLVPAYVEGAPLLTESLAWYSALGAVEREFGRDHLNRMLAMLRESYLTPRTRAGEPLLRASDWFLSYRKGPFAMQALREYVGEERVNGALRTLLARHAAPGAPLATSLDLYDELRTVTPDSLHGLLHDLFVENTYWMLRADSARAEPVGDGRWRVTFDVRATKSVVDTAGVETARPMNDPVDIGVYAAGAAEGRLGERLYIARHRLVSGKQRIVVEVDREPAFAVIDPDGLLIDVQAGDNYADVERAP